MHDNIPTWLAVPLIVILGLSALYRCYILPGYKKDRAEKSAQNGTK